MQEIFNRPISVNELKEDNFRLPKLSEQSFTQERNSQKIEDILFQSAYSESGSN